jgi:isoamylase
MLVSGSTRDVRDQEGEPIQDDTYLLLMNAHFEPLTFILPGREEIRWQTVINTAVPTGFLEQIEVTPAGEEIELTERSLRLLRLSEGEELFAHEESKSTREGRMPSKIPTKR